MVKEGGGYRNTPAKSSPYDISNSFVRRLASRVSGLFSQSTSNLSEDDNITQPIIRNTSMSEQNHVISPITQDSMQMSKRRRLHSLEDTQIHSNVGAEDAGRPGPSGYQRTHNMVSSTPAVMLTGSKLIRDNIAKQSTSRDIEVFEDACSELVPQSKYPNRSPRYKRVTHSPSTVATSGVIRCSVDVHRGYTSSDSDLESQSQLQLPANNLNDSNITSNRHNIHITSLNKNEPCFNPCIISATNTRKQLSTSLTSLSSSSLTFGNNMMSNRSLTTTQSPFYCNRTMYGGAATFSRSNGQQSNKVFNKTNIFSLPKKMSVKPISNKPHTSASTTDTNTAMSAAAKKILQTLNSYSSPIMDAKRVPMRESIDTGSSSGNKRKRKALTANLDETVPSMPDLLTIKRREMINKSTCEARSTSSAASSSSQSPNSTSKTKLKSIGGRKGGKYSDISSDETDNNNDDVIEPPSRINIVDNRTCVTKITKKRGKTDFDDSPVENVDLPNAVLEIKELPKFTPNLIKNCAPKPKTDKGNFSFAKPITESVSDVGDQIKLIMKDEQVKSTIELKNNNNNEVPKTKIETTNQNAGFFAPVVAAVKSSKWKCEECWVMNDESESKCVACAGEKVKTKPKNVTIGGNVEKWKCDTCWVMNEKLDENCKACTTPKVVAAGATSKVIGKAATTTTEKWKCEECWIMNEKDVVKCVACGTLKKGAEEKKEESKYSFGTTSKVEKKDEVKFTFGIPASNTKSQETPAVPEFKFGIPNSATAAEEKGNSTSFKFGNNLKPQDDKKEENKKSDEGEKEAPGFKFGFDAKLKEKSSENTLVNENFKSKEENSENSTFKFGLNSTSKFPNLSNSNSVPKFPSLNNSAPNSAPKFPSLNNNNSSITFGQLSKESDKSDAEPKKDPVLEVNTNGPETCNSIFKFGGNSTTSSESSTNFKFGSGFGSKETNADTTLFKFGSNSSTGGFSFGKPAEENKSTIEATAVKPSMEMFKPRLNDFGISNNSNETIRLGMKRPKSPSPVRAKKRPSLTEEPKVNGDSLPDTGMETTSPKWPSSNSLFPVNKTESNTNVFGSFQSPPVGAGGGGGGFSFKPTTQPFSFGSATTMPAFNFGPGNAFQQDINKAPNMFNTTPGATGTTTFASPFGNNNTNSTVDGPLKQEANDQLNNKPLFPVLNQPAFGANANTNFSQPQTGFNPVLPTSFNFSAGGAATRAFTAQPIPTIGAQTTPGIAQRKFRKAVRRSQMK